MASLFVEYKCDATAERSAVVQTAWSRDKDTPILAVATDNNAVTLYLEEGEPYGEEPIVRNYTASALEWHPTQRVLAIGWVDGNVTLWSLKDNMVRNHPLENHTNRINFVRWGPDGSRFVTGDASGQLNVWKWDHRPMPLYAPPKSELAMTHCVFVPRPNSDVVRTSIPGTSVPSPFFVGGETGIISQADDHGQFWPKYPLAEKDGTRKGVGPIATLLYNEVNDSVVIVTKGKSMQVIQFKIDITGNVTELFKVKLGTVVTEGSLKAMWAGRGLLATAAHEAMVRLFDLETKNNYVLPLADVPKCSGDRVTSIAFNEKTRVLAGGTRDGKVAMWKFVGGHNADDFNNWEILPPFLPSDSGRQVNDLHWGPRDGLLALQQSEGVSVLNETIMNRRMRNDVSALQLSSNDISFFLPNDPPVTLNTRLNVKGLDHTGQHCVVWNGKKVEVFEIAPQGCRMVNSFPHRAEKAAIHGESLYLAVDSRVEVTNFAGHTKQTLPFNSTEGDPHLLDVFGSGLAVATKNNVIKMWELQRREARQVRTFRKFEDVNGTPLGTIRSVRINCDGKRVSILCDVTNSSGIVQPDTRLWVYDCDYDKFAYYDFGGVNRYPVSHFWDPSEPKMLTVETRSYVLSKEDLVIGDEKVVGVEITTLFATPDCQVLLQNSFIMDKGLEGLIGVSVPNLFFSTKIEMKAGDEDVVQLPELHTRVMRDFVGMENVDNETREALLSFSYYLAIGSMDEAYKAVKLIQSHTVWENMANMCVKTKRLDVAEVCLGHMDHARGAKAVRETKASEDEPEVAIAMVAIQLGLIEEAERLYQQCNRYDLLNELYQATGQWDKSINVANKHDRIHLRTTMHKYAKHLVSIGDYDNAIKAFEESNTHTVEVPRMFYNSGLIYDLERYVHENDDQATLNWWAQYCESEGLHNKALKFYERSKDYMSYVRLLCFNKLYSRAEDVVNDTGNPLAAFQLARRYELWARSLRDSMDGPDFNMENEMKQKINEAVSYYSRAQCFSHALRLAREFELVSEMEHLALQSSKKLQLDTAKFFEERGEFGKAVTLYHKGGDMKRAIDMSFKHQLYAPLSMIANDLGENSDPALMEKCGDFFVQNGEYAKAVQLYVNAHQYHKALELCYKNSITITEEMADKMTPEKTEDPVEKNTRNELLNMIAKCCQEQGSYHLACKKYTQAGDKLKAMKVLLKSGDTEKIIFFAGVSRQRDIYILAANYLQNLDWHNDPEIMKSIIGFYTKAKALEQLAGFYDACSQVEIDEYRDYEKALGALKEAMKNLMKAKADDKEGKCQMLQQRIQIVEKFVQARKVVRTDPSEMENLCSQLLDQPDVESAIRVGDVFALLIEFYYHQSQSRKAYELIEKMRYRHIRLSPYLDREIVEAIYFDMGIEPIMEDGDAGGAEDAVDEDIEVEG